MNLYVIRADSRLAPSQWETALQSNAVSHWLGANLESAMVMSESLQRCMNYHVISDALLWHPTVFLHTLLSLYAPDSSSALWENCLLAYGKTITNLCCLFIVKCFLFPCYTLNPVVWYFLWFRNSLLNKWKTFIRDDVFLYMYLWVILLTHWGLDRMAAIFQKFEMHFLERKCMDFD